MSYSDSNVAAAFQTLVSSRTAIIKTPHWTCTEHVGVASHVLPSLEAWRVVDTDPVQGQIEQPIDWEFYGFTGRVSEHRVVLADVLRSDLGFAVVDHTYAPLLRTCTRIVSSALDIDSNGILLGKLVGLDCEHKPIVVVMPMYWRDTIDASPTFAAAKRKLAPAITKRAADREALLQGSRDVAAMFGVGLKRDRPRKQSRNVATKLEPWAIEALAESLRVKPLSEIAALIQGNWPVPYFGAKPYIAAMATMTSVQDNYGADSGSEIVRYALANMGSWRGDIARCVKAELKRRVAKI